MPACFPNLYATCDAHTYSFRTVIQFWKFAHKFYLVWQLFCDNYNAISDFGLRWLLLPFLHWECIIFSLSSWGILHTVAASPGIKPLCPTIRVSCPCRVIKMRVESTVIVSMIVTTYPVSTFIDSQYQVNRNVFPPGVFRMIRAIHGWQ